MLPLAFPGAEYMHVEIDAMALAAMSAIGPKRSSRVTERRPAEVSGCSFIPCKVARLHITKRSNASLYARQNLKGAVED